MKSLKGIFILFVCLFIGGILRQLIKFPIPDLIYGMIILFLLLATKLVKTDQVEEVSERLLENFAFLFLPLGVSLIDQLGILGQNILPIVAICLISGFITMGVTAKVVELVQKFRRAR